MQDKHYLIRELSYKFCKFPKIKFKKFKYLNILFLPMWTYLFLGVLIKVRRDYRS